MKLKNFILICACTIGFIPVLQAQIALLGDNSPHKNVNDGNFEQVKAYSWRKGFQSPKWTCSHGADEHTGDNRMALFQGRMYSSVPVGIIESIVLDNISEYSKPRVGDVLNWSFGADSEYDCNAKITISLVFGKNERVLAEKKAIKGGDLLVQEFSGTYTITKKDAEQGMPFVRATLYSNDGVKVFLNYVNISVQNPETNGPEKLNASIVSEGIQLNWIDNKHSEGITYNVYRGEKLRNTYKKLAENVKAFSYTDSSLINGKQYHYLVTRIGEKESSKSPVVTITKIDKVAPAPPTNLSVKVFDTEVEITWKKSVDRDVKNYSVYRSDSKGNNLRQIAHDVTKNRFVDFTPVKDIENTYVVFAHDFSGNKSNPSKPIKAKVKAVFGTSFSDLILPMPITDKLRSDIWGADGVIPRDPNNGIEDPEWSYWGGRPVKDKDGKYHMNVTRWPANATKGHWEWPFSTVAYTVADNPIGPYKVKKEIAYDFHNGLGHNPDIILLNDGTYMLYSLIDWEATLFTSNSMAGPWKRLGVMQVDKNTNLEDPERMYRFERNLSGVHLTDGRFLFVTKAGGMMISEGTDPLGPYKIVSKEIRHNPIIPEKYRNSGYEDPVLWKDDVQFHMMINAFWDYRAIYLRSPDGIHWKFNPGTAYTPHDTSYEDGTQTHWYKLERPHVLQDEFGRATHLSLAVIDVPKRDDLAKDKHNSKNIIMPLVLHKRIKMLNKKPINKHTKNIKILIKSEDEFNAQKDIDLSSLRYGASEEVNFGRGSKILKTKKKGKDLILIFNGEGNGITDVNFAGKLLGKTKNGKLLIGFSKLIAE
ncbi:fibronectin type 3 domain-containing protein [Lutibacter oricola]|uniref:Fibronectin type 3 domain-containing protein n=1 Tax=Lutibacter oricola TaxID=762486 RepID=A0A1H2SSM6_9FLAO|nr:hypothetical protein [Lutibacter oricola]SDW34632.1 fibronectin type 3 domain-containing protein [Lutibacter oricola]